MSEAVNLYSINNSKLLGRANAPLTFNVPKYSVEVTDKLELSNKNQGKNKEEKSSTGRLAADIAAFATGVIGIGVAVKVGKANKALKEALMRDKLTGLFNRRYLDEYLKKAFDRAKEAGSELHVVMFDIDRFKMVNTALGHNGGDRVLKVSSAAVRDVVEKHRKQGSKVMFARYGGEEFTLVAEGISKEKALQISNEIRSAVNQNEGLKSSATDFAKFFKNAERDLKAKNPETLSTEDKHLIDDYKFLHEHVDSNKGFTMSGGLCSLRDFDEIVHRPNEAVKLADLALERAKNKGRNRLLEPENGNIVDYAAYKLKDAFERRVDIPIDERVVLREVIAQEILDMKGRQGQQERIAELTRMLHDITQRYGAKR